MLIQPVPVEQMAEDLQAQFGQDAILEAIRRGGERVRASDAESALYWVQVWGILENRQK